MGLVDRVGRPAVVIALSFVLVACQTIGTTRLITSAVATQLLPSAATAIATDLATQLAAQIAPSGTTLGLRGEHSSFRDALEAALRNAGYAIVTEPAQPRPPDILDLAYIVDGSDPQILVRLSTPTLDVTRIYRLQAGIVEPASPVSVLRHEVEVP
jgi:type IV secretion system protein TrbH